MEGEGAARCLEVITGRRRSTFPSYHPLYLRVRQAARGKAEARASLLETQLAACTAASDQLTQRAAESELVQASLAKVQPSPSLSPAPSPSPYPYP